MRRFLAPVGIAMGLSVGALGLSACVGSNSEASACEQLNIAAQQGHSLAGSTAIQDANMVAGSGSDFADGVEILASDGVPTASEQSAIRSACGFGSDVSFQAGEVCRPGTGNC